MSLDLDKIKKELEILPEFKEQIALQGTKDNLDPFYACGAEIFNNTGKREHEFYTYHQDTTKRIHIPLVTNDKCFFIINSIVKQYPADGNYYVVDTTQMHTAINASKKDRIHIIGVINGL